jgi:SAM-dependent methyltransferase
LVDQRTSHPERVQLLFDSKASAWSAKYAAGGPLTSRLILFIAALKAHVHDQADVLDLGCGTGELARAAAASGMKVTACDISLEMLRRAADADSACAVQWIQLEPDWRTLPFDGSVLDCILAASVLEYVAEPITIFKECARVLRPGGILLCTVPNVRHPVRWLEWLAALFASIPTPTWSMAGLPRLLAYRTYLKVSHHRHSLTWWHREAARAGLKSVPEKPGTPTNAPLRLLAFRR